MPKPGESQNDMQRLIAVLKDLRVPYEVNEDGPYADVTLKASASDTYLTLTFKSGEYQYGN